MNYAVEKLLEERYLWKWYNGETTETIEKMFLRVTKKVASAEIQFIDKRMSETKKLNLLNDITTKFYNIIINGYFIPSSPQLFNAMRGIDTNNEIWYKRLYKDISEMVYDDYVELNKYVNKKSAFGSCYSMGNVGDSIEDIYYALYEQSEIFRASGGYGVNFSKLRGKGTKVQSINGESSGALEFMNLFNENTKIIALHSKLKRGANMILLHCSHPEIEEFIKIKSELNDDGRPKKLEHANLSVIINKKFIEAVKKDLEWKLIDPHTKNVKKVISAKTLFYDICESARISAEPGIINEDALNYYNPLKDVEYINSTNPCFRGDTIIETREGNYKIKDLVGKTVTVFDGYNWVKCDNFRKTGENKKLFRVWLQNKLYFDVTSSHRFYLKNGDIKECWELDAGDELETTSINGIIFNENKVDCVDSLNIQEDVYCCTIPTTHKFLVNNGIIIGQCGEFISFDKTVCNLGSINLYKMYDYKNNCVNKELLSDTTQTATHYLNNALFCNEYPLDELTKRSREYKPIGLGFMGLASVFIRNKIKYGSKKSIEITEEFTEEIMYNCIKESNRISKERGVFKNYEISSYAKGEFNFINTRYKKEIKELLSEGVCNSRFMAIAPTGSISMIASYMSEASNISGGIEPLFSLVYDRKINPNSENEYVVKQIDEGLYDLLKEKNIDINNINLSDDTYNKDYYRTAMSLKLKEHISIYEVINCRIDMGTSKTINMSNNTNTEDIMEYYMYAFDNNFKGGTVYVDGSRQSLLKEHKKGKEILINDKSEIVAKPRKQYYESITGSFKNNRGKTFITMCFEDKKPIEIFLMDGNDKSETIGRLISIGLRAGMSIDEFINQLNKVGGYQKEISDNIVNAIREYKISTGDIDSKDVIMINEFINRNKLILNAKGYYENDRGEYCSICFKLNSLIHHGGCIECKECGWNACGI